MLAWHGGFADTSSGALKERNEEKSLGQPDYLYLVNMSEDSGRREATLLLTESGDIHCWLHDPEAFKFTFRDTIQVQFS
jgi:hypothetical protein